MALNQQSVTSTPRARELKWIDDHFSELENYTNQWIVIEGDQLIAHDADYELAHERASKAGIMRPFIIFVPEPADGAFMGL
jgi:hypothetical protein